LAPEQGKYAAAAGRTALWQICQNKNMANKPRTWVTAPELLARQNDKRVDSGI